MHHAAGISRARIFPTSASYSVGVQVLGSRSDSERPDWTTVRTGVSVYGDERKPHRYIFVRSSTAHEDDPSAWNQVSNLCTLSKGKWLANLWPSMAASLADGDIIVHSDSDRHLQAPGEASSAKC